VCRHFLQRGHSPFVFISGCSRAVQKWKTNS
jgi:hypothetical protein